MPRSAVVPLRLVKKIGTQACVLRLTYELLVRLKKVFSLIQQSSVCEWSRLCKCSEVGRAMSAVGSCNPNKADSPNFFHVTCPCNVFIILERNDCTNREIKVQKQFRKLPFFLVPHWNDSIDSDPLCFTFHDKAECNRRCSR